MHIIEITIDGFKSYSVREVIGPFDKEFNAITGLNGSGKSNILDAICFVLGITQLGHMRAEKLQELVYKQGNSGVTKATVSIKFDNSNKAQSPPGYTEINQIVVTRSIENSKSKYYINGKTETAEKVKSLFCSVKLNINNPHFLIMQGRVTKVINMKPKEVLGLIEEAAGISLYQAKKAQTLELIRKKDTKLQEIEKIITEDVNPQLEKLRKEKEALNEFNVNQKMIEEYDRILLAFDYHEHDQFVRNASIKEYQLNESLGTIENELAVKEQNLKIIQVEMQTLGSRIQNSDEERKLKEQIGQLENEIYEQGIERDRIVETEKRFGGLKRNIIKEIATAEAEIVKNHREMDELTNETIPQCENELTVKKEARRNIESEIKALKEGKDNSGNQIQAIEREISDAQNRQGTCSNKFKAIEGEIKLSLNKLKEMEGQMNNSESNRAFIEQEKAKKKSEIQRIMSELQRIQFDENEVSALREDQAKLDKEFRDIENELNSQQMAPVKNQTHFRYNPPHGFNGQNVLGKVMTLFKIKDLTRFGLAVEAVAGGQLYNVVVKTANTARELIQNNSVPFRVTYVPLDKIDGRQMISDDKVRNLKHLTNNRVFLAKELLDYSPELEPAMNNIFGSTMVALDEDTAKKVAFYNDYGRFNCVTIKGDKYNPSGTLEGGYKQQGGFLTTVQKCLEISEKAAQKNDALRKINDKLRKFQLDEDQIRKFKASIEALQNALVGLEQNDLDAANRGGLTDKERIANLNSDIQALRQKLAETKANLEKIQAEVKTLQGEKESMKSMSSSQNKEKMFNEKLAKINKEHGGLEARLKDLQSRKNQAEIRAERAKQDIEDLKAKLAKEEQSLGKDRETLISLEKSLVAKRADHKNLKGKLKEAEAKKREDNQELDGQARRENALKEQIQIKKEEREEVAMQKARFEKQVNDSKKILLGMEKDHEWIPLEKEHFGVLDHRYDFKKYKIDKIREKTQSLVKENENKKKFINFRVDNMFEKVDTQYIELQKKKELTQMNKQKFEQTIIELDDLKNQEIQKTWQKVNKYYSEIFSTLLPHAGAKLMPVKEDDINEGLELKVSFSGAWKDSLSELSGGQRSLLALSLILALLKYHPAPVYILDEIDSALDLSHTQNIGLMIRRFFKSSQFVIVSLKEGLFQNANVLFKVSFNENRSTVKRFQVRSASAQNEEQKEDEAMH